jgi:hypothetical protein
MSIKRTPQRTLTVTSGRDTIGFISQYSKREFQAETYLGKVLGTYPTPGEAAPAIDAAKKSEVK